MAWIWTYDGVANSSVNLTPTTGAWALYYLKEALKQAGWSVLSSGDGLAAYSAVGDILTSGNSGANGVGNTRAWFRIRTPAGVGGREFIFQRGTANTTGRYKISHSAGFTGGAPGTLVTPSATDEAIYLGGGTDAAPSYGTAFQTDASYKLHIGTDNAAPYDVYMSQVTFGGATASMWWFLTMATGSYPAGDVAPYVVGVNLTATMAALTSGGGDGWYKKGLGGEAWVTFPAARYYFGVSMPTSRYFGINPYNGRSDFLPISLYRDNSFANAGWKGFLSLASIGLRTNQSGGVCGDYDDTPGGLRYMYLNDIAVRFPTTVVPTV